LTRATLLPETSWNQALAPYARPVLRRSLFQLLNTAIPFFLLWPLMLRSLEYSYWITLFLAVPAAGFLIRLFIIQHDCGHGSFFRSRAANDMLGFVLGVLTLTPYGYWRRTHAIHHATSGNLDQRDIGDVTTLTVKEYLRLPLWKRVRYRLYRHPLLLLGIGPVYLFVIRHRFPPNLRRTGRRGWTSVLMTNLVILAVIVVMWRTVGLQEFLKVQLPITVIAATAGVWLFYIQHQFEDTYWEKDRTWGFYAAGLRGSSFYDLPRILHWFTGNIGVHHVHHVCSRIPNYRLLECLKENPELEQVTHLTLWQSLNSIRLKLWDEDTRKLVGFQHLRKLKNRSTPHGRLRRISPL
jgi:omega-6 fatty acid desaturase (delta-12 desaturase)